MYKYFRVNNNLRMHVAIRITVCCIFIVQTYLQPLDAFLRIRPIVGFASQYTPCPMCFSCKVLSSAKPACLLFYHLLHCYIAAPMLLVPVPVEMSNSNMYYWNTSSYKQNEAAYLHNAVTHAWTAFYLSVAKFPIIYIYMVTLLFPLSFIYFALSFNFFKNLSLKLLIFLK